MTRRTLALAAVTLALPLALAAATAPPPAWQAKLEAFERTGEAERKKLGLDRDRDALRRRFPTPEVTFGEPVVACPGATADVRLGGKIQEGSLVVARTDAAEIVSGKRSGDGWAGKLAVAPNAAPGPVPLVVVSPVSTIEAYASPVVVGCRYTFTVQVGGDSLVVRGDLGADASQVLEGEWRRGGKVLGRTPYRVQVGEGSVDLFQDQTTEEMQQQVGGFEGMMESKAWKDLDARTNVEMKKLEGCGKLPPEKMAGCFAAPQKELERLNEARQALVAKAELAGAPAFGCRNLRLALRAGAVEGAAEQCAGKRTNDRVEVTGRYTSP